MKLTEFLEKHNACSAGREWALATECQTINEIWQQDNLKLEWRLWIATRPGVATDKQLRLFACACVRQIWHLLTDERSRAAVEIAERHVNGTATDADLTAAWAAARAAARDAAWYAARAAARAAAWYAAWAAPRDAAMAAARAAANAAVRDAARDAAMDAASAAAMAAVRDAARDAAWAAARAAAWDAASDAQNKLLKHLITNV